MLFWKERLSLKNKVQCDSERQSGQGVEGIGRRVPQSSLGELVTRVRMGPCGTERGSQKGLRAAWKSGSGLDLDGAAG